MLQYRVLPVTPFQQNCSIIWCDETNKAAVIDPGGEVSRIKSLVDQLGVDVEQILLTHGHMDHVGGTAELKALFKVPVIGPHKEDLFWIAALDDQAQMMNFPPVPKFTPDCWLSDGDKLQLGNQVLDVVHCPGHTPGHVVLVDKQSKIAFVGDVLFAGSIGRTDFPRGDYQTLIDAIRKKLFPLGDDIAFVPGHGPNSSFGRERENNPFVSDSRFS
ncbi:glyoxylase-like metal-dependent hydrolase (beta-lactamase superfamily II) [Alteromonadaceae bacterium 2753L.S.0a.02]|nr:glyoxylase-like metal-dependent hydrolase (beta-lactamase superfamily II) [Alteromonadaceae bacterium 2753L.S.0a.02]